MNEVSFMDQLIIRKLTDIVYANLEKESFGVRELALTAGMSRSSLNRRLKSILKKSSTQFIRELRLQKAMERLQMDMDTASEISYKVGFNSPTYFNYCFHQYYGFPPGEVRKREWIGLGEATGVNNNLSETDNRQNPPMASSPEISSPVNAINLTVVSAVILTFLFLTFIWYFLFVRKATMSDVPRLKHNDKSIVVLPFKNLSDNGGNQYFADGVMEDILNQLFNIKELKVISRTTGDNFPPGTNSAPEISRKLGVNFILEGSVQQHENMVRVIVQLIDARQDRHIWSEKYDKEIADIFLIQSSIAKQVADKLEAILSSDEIERIEKIPTRNPEAYNLYLKGRFNWINMSRESLKKSIPNYEMAIAADPNYALAYLGLADAYYFQTWWGWANYQEGYRNANSCIRRALELDNNLTEAHATLGGILCWNDWDWKGAQKEFDLALKFNPNNAKVHQLYSEYLDMIGNNNGARDHINKALKLDPVSPVSYYLSALYFYHEGKFDLALENCKKVERLNSDPLTTNRLVFDICFWKNEKLKAFNILLENNVLISSPENYSMQLKEAYNQDGLNGLLKLQIQRESNKTMPDLMLLARWNAMLGKKREALKWLNLAFENHLPQLPKINNDPDFECLRRETQFLKIINHLGLTQIYKAKTDTKNLVR